MSTTEVALLAWSSGDGGGERVNDGFSDGVGTAYWDGYFRIGIFLYGRTNCITRKGPSFLIWLSICTLQVSLVTSQMVHIEISRALFQVSGAHH